MSGPSYPFGSSLVDQSPIADKYYLQLADHSLLDLLREAVKSILIFNLPLEELPILHLQKEIYLIYDNRIIKEQDVIDAIKHEIRQTAKLQKKFLDMSFTYLEKEKIALSDMRDSQEDVWSISWNRYKAKDTDDSLKKSYGVVANIFCNNYNTFVQSIREISRLLEHLHHECLIPAVDTQLLQESLLEIVTHQFFLQYNCLDLHKVLPIMAQPQKQQFVYCSQFGTEMRQKISKYSTEQNLYDIFLPKKKSPERSIEPPERDNKNQLKQIMKEMFLREFKNNQIISPLLFDEAGKLKLFDEDHDYDDDDDYFDEEAEKEIARLAFKPEPKIQPKKEQMLKKDNIFDQIKRQVITQTKKDSKIQETIKQEKVEIAKNQKKIQQVKKELKSQQVKKDIKVDDSKKQQKNDPKPQPKSDAKEKGMRDPSLKVDSAPLPQTHVNEKQPSQIPTTKRDKKEQKSTKIKAEAPQNTQPSNEKRSVQSFEKPKNTNQASSKEQKDAIKPFNEKKVISKTIHQDCKSTNQSKEGQQSVELIRQTVKAKEATAESLKISTTKIVHSSGTTLEARITSLTISAEDPDKLNKSINLLNEIHTMRKSMSNSEVLQQIAKGYGQSDIKLECFEEKGKTEEEDEKVENQTQEAVKKKKKRNKKKKNKKSEQHKEQLTRMKSESLEHNLPERIELSKSASPQKTQSFKQDALTEEERAIYHNIDNLEIDDKLRIDCKIDESMLSNWRKKFFALKKQFPK